MIEVFLSYRTTDSAHATAMLSELLGRHFGRQAVFRDHDSLGPGMPYPQHIRRAVARADTVLAVIGPTWLSATDPAGARRIDRPDDWVRTELRTAFSLDIPVVPVRLDDTELPAADDLPEDIARLSRCTAWQVRQERMVDDITGLARRLDPTVHEDRSAPSSTSDSTDQAPGGQNVRLTLNGTTHADHSVFGIRNG